MTRSRRRLAAWLGILGIAFAQVAVTAHACLTGASVNASSARAVAMAHEGHCTGVQGNARSAPLAPIANACEVQCTDGAPSSAAPDLPPVALAVLPVALTPVAMTLSEPFGDSTWLAAISAQPPPLLQFGRFLN